MRIPSLESIHVEPNNTTVVVILILILVTGCVDEVLKPEDVIQSAIRCQSCRV